MQALWIPVIIWFVGFLVMLSPRFLRMLVKKKKRNLEHKSKQAQPIDKSQSKFYQMEETIINQFRIKYLCLITSIIGVFLVTFGFVTFGFILLTQ